MKKSVIISIVALLLMPLAYGQNDSVKANLPWMLGFNLGVGIPVELCDISAAGASGYAGFDFAYPLTDQFALGFYSTLGGGFMKEILPFDAPEPKDESDMYGEFGAKGGYDNIYSVLRFSTGLLMQIGDLRGASFVLGVCPCVGVGLVDMDLVLPVELRIGHVFRQKWYVMADLVYGVSLANETQYLEPTIRVGYNFGLRKKSKKH